MYVADGVGGGFMWFEIILFLIGVIMFVIAFYVSLKKEKNFFYLAPTFAQGASIAMILAAIVSIIKCFS